MVPVSTAPWPSAKVEGVAVIPVLAVLGTFGHSAKITNVVTAQAATVGRDAVAPTLRQLEFRI